jgi:hypothetical protein
MIILIIILIILIVFSQIDLHEGYFDGRFGTSHLKRSLVFDDPKNENKKNQKEYLEKGFTWTEKWPKVVAYDPARGARVIAYQQWNEEQLNQKPEDKFPEYKCCKVQVKLNKNKYGFDFNKLSGKECRPMQGNTPVLNWVDYFYYANDYMPSEEFCSNDYKDKNGDPRLGSCRFNEMTCQNFHTKQSCAKHANWVWDSKPCREKLERKPIVIKYNRQLLPNY